MTLYSPDAGLFYLTPSKSKILYVSLIVGSLMLILLEVAVFQKLCNPYAHICGAGCLPLEIWQRIGKNF